MIDKLLSVLKSNANVLVFMAVLCVVHVLWHYGFSEEFDSDGSARLCFLGLDVSALFYPLADRVAADSLWLVRNVFGCDGFIYHSGRFVALDRFLSVSMVWNCNGMKQMIFFFLVVLLTPGRHVHKLWFVPLGLIVVYLFNLLRISTILSFSHYNASWFDFMHESSKYIFYLVIFGMWVIWDIYFGRKHESDN